MTFFRFHNPILWNYKFSDTIIERGFDSILDLGFKLSSNLNLSEHISTIFCKSLKILGFSKDLKLSRSLKSLYCALVRPILEYGLEIWNPYTVIGSNQLERVQCTFLSFVGFSLGIPRELTHSPVADALWLHTLSERRHMLSTKFFNDLIFNKIDSPTLLSLINFKIPPCSTRSNISFHIPRATDN
jgi:hypothetical protein